ncbi:hypothetical protein V6N13_135188 [Hibiscus sabdariffa]
MVRTGHFRVEVGDGFGAEAVKSRKTEAAWCETMVPLDGVNKFLGSVSRKGEATMVRALGSFPVELNFFCFPRHASNPGLKIVRPNIKLTLDMLQIVFFISVIMPSILVGPDILNSSKSYLSWHNLYDSPMHS